MISPIPSSDSLDYANSWRSPHAEPPSHIDRKSCSTRREISSPGHGYGCPNIADTRLPRLRESLAEPTRGAAQSHRSAVVFNSTRDLLPSSDSLDYANHWRSPHAEPPSHFDRKSCSTRCEISSPGRGYGCPNIADIVTPSGLFPPLQQKNWA
ncbi:hypothetical protein Taro_042761 [Colocasia esculenta]|uniref:Uncharacterized protein n=1 Tax=Colocasia esculenta TaxID=4460 RepID=A0A843WHP9_COLES|nr:hypothetical protein [Colocasia esculenta]